MRDGNFFPIERNRYFYGKLLTVRDFEAEQNYSDVKRRLVNRIVHGAGVVCGLGVTLSDDTTLIIESGMALDYQGREIVIEEPLVRKVEMIEGHERLNGLADAYLCLAYDEADIEPVNAVGAEAGESRFNMTREGGRLYFSAEAPEFRGLMEAEGRENVSVIYTSDQLTLVLFAPSAVCAGDEIEIGVLIVKNDKTARVSFTLEGENGFVDSEKGSILIEYSESPTETRNVIETSFRVKIQGQLDAEAQLFPDGAELNIELGSHKYRNFITINSAFRICATAEQLKEHMHKTDTLTKHMLGRHLPIYLAKLELLGSMDKVFIRRVMNLPFGQLISSGGASQLSQHGELAVTAAARTLEYWQKPDVNASYNKQSGNIHLDFGIPAPEIYDYMTSHGVVEIPLPGGIKVNARYVTDEIAHGLGPGNVDVRLGLEFDSPEGTGYLFGNSEVFKLKSSGLNLPWVEVASILYPARGTMRIGVWLHDNVAGNLLRVRYYAQKPERDTQRLLESRRANISILPEVSRLGKRGQMRFRATVEGTEDTNVIWEVRDNLGGVIDQNGLYQAPEAEGTYEIVARARTDESLTVSAFVIVE